jgi:hypothetical protein
VKYERTEEAKDVDDEATEPLPKNPKNYIFPEQCPAGCLRNCKRFYMAHTPVLSFALYATQNPDADPARICAYAFSCGQNLESFPFTKGRTETPINLLRRCVPQLIIAFQELAKVELEVTCVNKH